MNGFFLGLSGGVTCLTYCAPVILPYYLNKGEGVKRNYKDLILFMSGRLLGYMIFGIAAWFIGRILLEAGPAKAYVMGGAYILIAITLILSFFKEKQCPVKRMEPFRAKLSKYGVLFPALLGFATGVNLCPTFLLVFTEASNMKSVLESLGFFFLFYLGTSIYFLPLPLVGLLRKKDAIRIIGNFMIAYICIYYLYKGFAVIFNFGGIV